MTVLDVVLLLLLALSAWGGYRRGAVLQVAGLIGLGIGFVVGVWIAPVTAELVRSDPAKAAVALGTILLLGAIGDAAGSVLGVRLRKRAHGTRFKTADSVGGGALSVAALVLAIWFLGLNLAAGPFPSIARSLQRSTVVRAVDTVLPPPPALAAQIGNVLDIIGFPDVFSGLPPLPADPVPQPGRGLAARAADAARSSVVLVSGPACDTILQGTGVVVEDDLVLTNAHVIAGSRPRVEWDGQVFDAVPLVFDEDLDAAVLRVEGLDAPALTLLAGEVARGTGGAVIGYPHGGTGSSGRPSDARSMRSGGTSTRRTRHDGGSTSYRSRSNPGTAAVRSWCPVGGSPGSCSGPPSRTTTSGTRSRHRG